MRIQNYFNEIVNNLYMFQEDDLEKLKRELNCMDIKHLDELLTEGLAMGIHSVTEKKHLAPSQNPHDYMSCSIYHWPNPDTANGLPYVERDGVDNPEAIHGDKESLRTLTYITYLSSLLYYFTNEEKYLDIVVKYNSFWFIEENTKMNPNLRYAQCIPGVNDGEPGGIIDYAASYSYALNLLRILNEKGKLPTSFYQEMRVWHQEFLSWLLSSEQGIIEGNRKNNQGSLYDLLILNISCFIQEEKALVERYYQRLLRRLHEQIDSKGELPYELVRTKSKSYTTMGLKMLLESACLLMNYGYEFKDNEDLVRAYHNVRPHYVKHTWEHMQIKAFDPFRGYYILYLFFKTICMRTEFTMENEEMHWGSILLRKLF